MSAKAKRNNDPPGFRMDPNTGKYVLVPLDLRALLGDDYKPQYKSPWSNGKRTVEKAKTPENYQAHKYKKLEHGVRKELFKQSASEGENKVGRKSLLATRRSSLSKNQYVSGRPSFIAKKNTQVKKGLPTISEAESRLSGTGQENGQKPGFSFSLPLPQLQTPKELNLKENHTENAKTPDEIEFLRYEEQLKTPKVIVESPVSTVCSLFENKMLIDVKEPQTAESNLETNMNINSSEIIAEIKRLAKRDQDLCDDTMKKIKEVQEQQLQHQENFKTILSLVDRLETKHNLPSQNADDNDESSAIKRRSLRLRNKSPKASPRVGISKSGTVAGSPVILKSGDLRKSALTKSLVNNCQKYQIDSPRIQKALDLYNSVKSVGNILLTPKLSREEGTELSPNSKFKKNLSLKVQQQCLLLQDTPVHKTKSERS